MMVSSSPTALATLLLLSFVLPALTAPIGIPTHRQIIHDDIHPSPTLLGETLPIPTPTRSSKYAVDYLPSAIPKNAVPTAEVVATSTRSSKYAVDYLPTWAVHPPGPHAVGGSDEEVSVPIPTPTTECPTTVEATASSSSSKPRATSIRPSKYAIDYLPTRSVQPPPQATHA